MVTSKYSNLKEDLEGLRDKHKNIETQIKKLEERILELYTLYSISKTLNLSSQLDELFKETMKILGDVLGIDEYCVMLMRDGELAMKVTHGFVEDVKDVRFRLNEGVSGRVAATGEAVLINDVSRDKDFLYYKGAKKDIGSFISVPLKGNGETIGVLNAHRSEKNAFKKGDMDFFMVVAEDIAVAVEKARLFEKTKEDASRDELTKLYNRRVFFDNLSKEIKRAKRYKKIFSVAIMDIDHFKNYNDLNGHLNGDKALMQTARIMEQSLRGEDIVARFGGEEFIVLLPEIDKKKAVMAAEKLRSSIEKASYVGEELLPGGKFTACFGISTYPEDGEDGLQLIDMADKALYLSKQKGRNRVFSSSDLP